MGNNPVNGIDPDGGFFISQADGGKSWPGYWEMTDRKMPVVIHEGSSISNNSWSMYNRLLHTARKLLPYTKHNNESLVHSVAMKIRHLKGQSPLEVAIDGNLKREAMAEYSDPVDEQDVYLMKQESDKIKKDLSDGNITQDEADHAMDALAHKSRTAGLGNAVNGMIINYENEKEWNDYAASNAKANGRSEYLYVTWYKEGSNLVRGAKILKRQARTYFNSYSSFNQRAIQQVNQSDGGGVNFYDAASLGIGVTQGTKQAVHSLSAIANKGSNSVRTIKNLVKVSKLAGRLGVAGVAVSGVETFNKLSDGSANTSTFVDFGANVALVSAGSVVAFTLGAGAAVVAAPVIIGIGITYGVARIGWGDDMDAYIDGEFGYK